MLAESPEMTPPEGAKQRLFDKIEKLDSEEETKPFAVVGDESISEPTSVVKGPWTRLIPWGLAACFAVLSIALYLMPSNELEVTVLDSQTGDGSTAVAVWDGEKQEVILTVFGMPKLDPAKNDYQLWIVDGQYKVPVDGGIFQVSAEGRVTHRFKAPLQVDSAEAFAITKEIKGGVAVSKGPHLLLGAKKS